MTFSDIKNINDRVALAVQENEYEAIFLLGIELGKSLQTANIEFNRLPFFIEKEEKANSYARIRSKCAAVSNLLHWLLYITLARQLERAGGLEIDSDECWNNSVMLIDEDIQIKSRLSLQEVRQTDLEDDFVIRWKLLEDLEAILERFKLPNKLETTIFNLDCTSSRYFRTREELKDGMGYTHVGFRSTLHSLDEGTLDELFNAIEKATMFLRISYSEI